MSAFTENQPKHLPGGLTLEQHKQSCQSFRQFLLEPGSRPRRDPHHGTMYRGTVRLLHFVFYALLRGKSPASTSHSPTRSPVYLESIQRMRQVVKDADWVRNASFYQGLAVIFGLSPEQCHQVLISSMERGLI